MLTAEASIPTGMPTPDSKPQIILFQLVDNASGHVLAQAALSALLNRERHEFSDIVASRDVQRRGSPTNQTANNASKQCGRHPDNRQASFW